jgi:RNA polymerase sigma-70 factor (ECF subfamily)
MRKAPLGTPSALSDSAQRDLVARYADAFHRDDIAGMVALLQRDATTSMPPFAWWVRGRDGIGAVMAGSDGSCHGARLVPDSFNGSPACWQFRPTGPGAAFEPFALVVFEVGDRLIRSMTTFLGDPVCLLAPPFPAAAPAPGAAVSGPGFAGRERG